jgi:hypothetical protein
VPPGEPLSPDAPESGPLIESDHPGILLREAELDAHGNVVKETFRRVPLDRDLQTALDWAAKKYASS